MLNKVMTILGIAATIVAICAVVIVVVIRGGTSALSLPGIVSLLGLIGTLVGLLAMLVNNASILSKVNGHLQQHMQQPSMPSGKVKIEAEGTIVSNTPDVINTGDKS